jgi:hypothetical protein
MDQQTLKEDKEGIKASMNKFYKPKFLLSFFSVLTLVYFIIEYFKISNDRSCGSISYYFFDYCLLFLAPFLMIYFFIFLEKKRKVRLNKEKEISQIDVLQYFAVSIFLLTFLFMNVVAFYDAPNGCPNYYGFHFQLYDILYMFVFFGFEWLCGIYAGIMILVWIYRFFDRFKKK